MAFEITKCFKGHYPAMRFIGRRYTDADRGADGSFGHLWDEWNSSGRIGFLMGHGQAPNGVSQDMYGLMTVNSENHSNFTYWIGIPFLAGTDVPDGCQFLDLPESDIGMTCIFGGMDEIFGEGPHTASHNKLNENGMGKLNHSAGGENTLVFFEQYGEEFDQPDENGKVTLGYGFYIA